MTEEDKIGNSTEEQACSPWCRRECRLSSFGLNHPEPKLFYTAQWRCHPLVYVVYRTIVGLYFFGWIIHTGTGNRRYANSEANRVKWFIYLTNWTTFLLTISVMVQAVIAIYCYIKHERKDNVLTSMTWYLKLEWVLYNISVNSAFVLSILYWGLLYSNAPAPIEEIMIHTHAINSIYVLIDIFLTAMPLRLLHVVHGMAYAVVYIIFSVIYTMAGGTNSLDKPYIYNVLDWKKSPGTATAYGLATLFVAIPVVWLVDYGIYCLRLVFARRCCCSSCHEYKEERADAMNME